jgi:hypothetical protein
MKIVNFRFDKKKRKKEKKIISTAKIKRDILF